MNIKFLFLLILTIFCFSARGHARISPKNEKQILLLIEERSRELNGKLEDIEHLHKEGLVTLQEGDSFRDELNELDQFKFIIQSKKLSEYENLLKDRLNQKVTILKLNLKNLQELWNEGLIATKEVESVETKAALYNYILEYLNTTQKPEYLADSKNKSKFILSIVSMLGKKYPIESNFGFRIDPINNTRKQFHAGIDIPAWTGTPIKPPLSGIVSKVVYNTNTGGGLQVRINHNNGFETVYMHLSKIMVKHKQKVTEKDIIGLVGATGNRVTGLHLHLEVHYNRIPIDPIKFIK